MKKMTPAEQRRQKSAWFGFGLLLLALLLGALAFASVARAEEPEKSWSGFAYLQGASVGRERDLTTVRLKAWNEDAIGGLGIYADVDIREDGNEVQQFFLFRERSWGTVRIGRIFLAACYSTPAPFLYTTGSYPRAAFTIAPYAYGVQWERSWGGLWNLMADISGSSSTSYDSSDQFDRLETSFRLKRNIGTGHIAVAAQLSDEFIRLATDGSYSRGEFTLSGGLYYSDESDRERSLAILGNVEWEATDWLRPHVQLDMRANGNDVWAVGTALGIVEKFFLTADYEIGGENDGDVVLRTQYRWDF